MSQSHSQSREPPGSGLQTGFRCPEGTTPPLSGSRWLKTLLHYRKIAEANLLYVEFAFEIGHGLNSFDLRPGDGVGVRPREGLIHGIDAELSGKRRVRLLRKGRFYRCSRSSLRALPDTNLRRTHWVSKSCLTTHEVLVGRTHAHATNRNQPAVNGR